MPARINLRFGCSVPGCDCVEVIIWAQAITRSDGSHFYEHTNRCPNCLHPLSKHRMTEAKEKSGDASSG